MKQKLIITAFCALAIVACTSKQNKSGEAAKSTDTETVASDDNTAVVAQDVENSTAPVFVLANNDGSKFLLKQNFEETPTDAPDNVKNYKYILYNGVYYNVEFAGVQSSNEGDNGRDTPYNFDNRPGWLFKMQSGKLLEKPVSEWDMFWGKPLLVDESFKNETKLLKIKNADEADQGKFKDLKAKLEKQYNKKTTKFKVNQFFGDYALLVVQFETVENKALGVVALVKPDGGCVLKEYPADWHEFSVWREGDEGEFYGLDVDFATIEHGNLTLYTVTEGEEGASYQNFVVKGDSLVEGSISNYFYHAPD